LPLEGLVLNYFIASIIFGLIIYLIKLFKAKRYKVLIALTFIILGAISNLFDRFRFGFVIDYFDLKYFTVFNLADMMITLSIFILLFKEIKRGNRFRRSAP
jgi:signal peptidase II